MPKLADKILLTDVKCRNAKPTDGILWDAAVPKLGLLVSPTGKRSFVFVSRFAPGANPVKRTLGVFPLMSLDAARTEARRWHELLGKGIDPGASARQAPTTDAGPYTFAKVAEQFIAQYAVGPDRENPLKRRGLVSERRLQNLVIPFQFQAQNETRRVRFGDRLVTEITQAHISPIIQSHVARNCPGMARDLLTIIRSVFSWAIGVGQYGLTSSPCAHISPGKLRAVVNTRQRVLTDAEIVKYWKAADEEDAPWRCFFQLAMLTACRRSELSCMEWPELDLVENIWKIPPEKMKMDRGHWVPLSSEMLEIIDRRKGPHKKGWEYVLSSNCAKGRRPLSDFDAAQTRVQERMFAMGGGDAAFTWTLQDVRRTVRTRLTELNVVHEVAESILAHAKEKLEGTYNVSEYIDQKYDALTLWEDCLMDMVIDGWTWEQSRVCRGVIKGRPPNKQEAAKEVAEAA
jgi:integrase